MDFFIFLSPTFLFLHLYGSICSYSHLPREPRFLNGPIANDLFFPTPSLPSQSHRQLRGEDQMTHSLVTVLFVFVIRTMTMPSSTPYCLTNILSNTSSNMHHMSISNYLLLPLSVFYYSHFAWISSLRKVSWQRYQFIPWPDSRPLPFYPQEDVN